MFSAGIALVAVGARFAARLDAVERRDALLPRRLPVSVDANKPNEKSDKHRNRTK